MRFLYVFSLMFLSIFGLAVFVKTAAYFLLSRGARRHDVYVVSGEDIFGVVEAVRSSPRVGRVIIVAAGNEWDNDAKSLAERYADVEFMCKDMAVNGQRIGNNPNGYG